jgi:hypothetical protein
MWKSVTKTTIYLAVITLKSGLGKPKEKLYVQLRKNHANRRPLKHNARTSDWETLCYTIIPGKQIQ